MITQIEYIDPRDEDNKGGPNQVPVCPVCKNTYFNEEVVEITNKMSVNVLFCIECGHQDVESNMLYGPDNRGEALKELNFDDSL